MRGAPHSHGAKPCLPLMCLGLGSDGYSWVFPEGGAHIGRPTKVPAAALSRAAATVHGLQARIAHSAAVIVCILQEELVKMGYKSTSLA